MQLLTTNTEPAPSQYLQACFLDPRPYHPEPTARVSASPSAYSYSASSVLNPIARGALLKQKSGHVNITLNIRNIAQAVRNSRKGKLRALHCHSAVEFLQVNATFSLRDPSEGSIPAAKFKLSHFLPTVFLNVCI